VKSISNDIAFNMLLKMQRIRGCSMLSYALGLPHEMVCGAQTMEMRTLVFLTRRRPLLAAFANSQQILKQVQDD
jgi:hypothetical protein